jgi:hypothetical protein
MNKIIMEEVYTGGGCEHLSIQFVDYGVQFDIMNADEYSANQLPEGGKPFCFNLRKITEMVSDGDYIETSDRIENYQSQTIKDFCLGYLAALKLKPVVEPVPYDITELVSSINDIYQQKVNYDITMDEAHEITKRCCDEFIAWYAQSKEGK